MALSSTLEAPLAEISNTRQLEGQVHQIAFTVRENSEAFCALLKVLVMVASANRAS
jgi:hypothetical protein